MIRVYSLYLPISGKIRVDSWLYHSICSWNIPRPLPLPCGVPQVWTRGHSLLLCLRDHGLGTQRLISKIHSAIFQSERSTLAAKFCGKFWETVGFVFSTSMVDGIFQAPRSIWAWKAVKTSSPLMRPIGKRQVNEIWWISHVFPWNFQVFPWISHVFPWKFGFSWIFHVKLLDSDDRRRHMGVATQLLGHLEDLGHGQAAMSINRWFPHFWCWSNKKDSSYSSCTPKISMCGLNDSNSFNSQDFPAKMCQNLPPWFPLHLRTSSGTGWTSSSSYCASSTFGSGNQDGPLFFFDEAMTSWDILWGEKMMSELGSSKTMRCLPV